MKIISILYVGDTDELFLLLECGHSVKWSSFHIPDWMTCYQCGG